LVKSCKEKNELKLVKTGQNGKKYWKLSKTLKMVEDCLKNY
jgi:hypothetical protein